MECGRLCRSVMIKYSLIFPMMPNPIPGPFSILKSHSVFWGRYDNKGTTLNSSLKKNLAANPGRLASQSGWSSVSSPPWGRSPTWDSLGLEQSLLKISFQPWTREMKISIIIFICWESLANLACLEVHSQNDKRSCIMNKIWNNIWNKWECIKWLKGRWHRKWLRRRCFQISKGLWPQGLDDFGSNSRAGLGWICRSSRKIEFFCE